MKQMILTQFPWTSLPVLALVIFFCFFVGLIVHINLKSKNELFKQASMIPLTDSPNTQEGSQNER